MNAYVINLDARIDRWSEVQMQSNILSVATIRVPAVNTDTVVPSPFVTPVIAATWQSHQKAMKMFLASGDDYGLIMEDDFLILRRFNPRILELNPSLRFDFLQVGYLITGFTDRVQVTMNGLMDYLLKILLRMAKMNNFLFKRLGYRLLIREQEGMPFSIVCNDIRPGAHAYIVSRQFAEAAISINSPEFLSSDALFMSMGWMRSFRMLRLRHSAIGQSNSQTSINERFINN